MCLHIFSWCRLTMWWSKSLGMGDEDMYDRMVIFAGVAHLPFIADHWAPVGFVVFIFWWNYVFNLLQPFPRELLTVNRGFHDVFNDSYKDPDGKIFTEVLQEYKE